MSTVRVTNPGLVMLNGQPTALRLDDAYDTDDEVVQLFPSMFGRDNSDPDDIVEAATAAPGERRQVRRS